MNIKTTLKSSVAVAALFAVAAPVANAADDTLKSGNKNSVTMSGQIVRALSHVDDGNASKVFNTGGEWQKTRVRWVAQGSLSANVTVGGVFEADLAQSNNGASADLPANGTDGSLTDSTGWGIRHEYVWVNHKKFGKASLGQTDGASNGSSEADYSGTTIFAASATGGDTAKGVIFKETSTAVPSTSSVTLADAFSNFDGASRDDVLRYDTPRFYGLQLKAAQIQGDMWDVGADYQGKFGGFKVNAKAGYYDKSGGNASSNYVASGSVAVLHDSGLNLALAYGKEQYSGPQSKITTTSGETEAVEDPSMIYVGVGYKAKLFGVGGTNFAVSWQETTDKSQDSGIDDSEATAWKIKAVQEFSAIGTSVGIEYSNYSLDANNGTANKTFDDIDVVQLLTVFKF